MDDADDLYNLGSENLPSVFWTWSNFTCDVSKCIFGEYDVERYASLHGFRPHGEESNGPLSNAGQKHYDANIRCWLGHIGSASDPFSFWETKINAPDIVSVVNH